MSHCTGPYTRIPFEKRDSKPILRLLDGLRTAGFQPTVKQCPSGNGGSDDFALDLEIVDRSDEEHVWDIRAAKFIGPQKLFVKTNIFEIAIRRRDADNKVVWEGYLFSDRLKTLAKRLPADLRSLIAGESIVDLVDGPNAQDTRIRLCTGT